MPISTYKETVTEITPDGTEFTTTKETTAKIERSTEPDYIKLYTSMWCEYNGIPKAYRGLFFELVCRMSYCSATDLEGSQIVYSGEPWASSIMKALGWKRAMYQKGIQALCACGALKQLRKGVYQVNPLYAGKGEWKYNPRLQRGGVEDLVAIFKFRDHSVDTKILWADDGTESELNSAYREGLGVKGSDQTVLKASEVRGQMSLEDPEIKALLG